MKIGIPKPSHRWDDIQRAENETAEENASTTYVHIGEQSDDTDAYDEFQEDEEKWIDGGDAEEEDLEGSVAVHFEGKGYGEGWDDIHWAEKAIEIEDEIKRRE